MFQCTKNYEGRSAPITTSSLATEEGRSAFVEVDAPSQQVILLQTTMMAMIEPIDAAAGGDSNSLSYTNISPTFQHLDGMGTVLAAVAEHGRGGIVAAATGEDHDASPDDDIVLLPPVADQVMVALDVSALIPTEGDIGGVGGGARGGWDCFGTGPQGVRGACRPPGLSTHCRCLCANDGRNQSGIDGRWRWHLDTIYCLLI